MEEKTPFSFRNQIISQQPISQSYKTTTVSTSNNEDFVTSMNKEMEMIMQNIEPKSLSQNEYFHGSPHFNQNLISEMVANNFSQKKQGQNNKEHYLYSQNNNDSFGQENENERKIPIEMYFC